MSKKELMRNLYSNVSFGGGGGGGESRSRSRSGHDGGRDGYPVKDSYHTRPGRDANYASGRNSNDPQGYWGRPTINEGDSYSGSDSYGSGDGR